MILNVLALFLPQSRDQLARRDAQAARASLRLRCRFRVVVALVLVFLVLLVFSVLVGLRADVDVHVAGHPTIVRSEVAAALSQARNLWTSLSQSLVLVLETFSFPIVASMWTRLACALVHDQLIMSGGFVGTARGP